MADRLKSISSVFGLVFIFFYLSSCQTDPAIKSYPVRLIDRPYALPDKMASWEISGSYIQAFAPQTVQNNEFDFNFQWREALSDNLTLIWNPLPLGIAYQPLRSDSETVGVSWYIGSSYRGGELSIQPIFSSFYLSKINRSLAIDTRLFYLWDFPLNESFSSWSAGISSGPLFQLSDVFSLTPNLGVSFRNLYFRKIFSKEQDPPTLPPDLSFPVGIRILLTGGNLWDVGGDCTFGGINFQGASYTNEFKIHYTRYW